MNGLGHSYTGCVSCFREQAKTQTFIMRGQETGLECLPDLLSEMQKLSIPKWPSAPLFQSLWPFLLELSVQ